VNWFGFRVVRAGAWGARRVGCGGVGGKVAAGFEQTVSCRKQSELPLKRSLVLTAHVPVHKDGAHAQGGCNGACVLAACTPEASQHVSSCIVALHLLVGQ